VKRRALLKSALALPMIPATTSVQTTPLNSVCRDSEPVALFSGLPGLDYALGGIRPNELICVAGPPSTGKTLLLLDLAARLCSRYEQNVVFYSRHLPSVYLAKKGAIKADVTYVFADGSSFDRYSRETDEGPAVILLDSTIVNLLDVLHFTTSIATGHPAGCAALIIDGQSAAPIPRRNTDTVDEMVGFPAERWPPTQLSAGDLYEAQKFVQSNRGPPVVMGIKTASLFEDEAVANSLDLGSHLRVVADRLVTLHRPELYVETSQAKATDRNVVCLSGTSPHWWDTRCSRLRFDPRRLGYSTVI
jgi:DnaB-like helicase C terminal domain